MVFLKSLANVMVLNVFGKCDARKIFGVANFGVVQGRFAEKIRREDSQGRSAG